MAAFGTPPGRLTYHEVPTASASQPNDALVFCRTIGDGVVGLRLLYQRFDFEPHL